MKLLTLKNLIPRDDVWSWSPKILTRCCEASNYAPTLQAALDGLAKLRAKAGSALSRLSNMKPWPCERFHERAAESPCPRAYSNGPTAAPISIMSNWSARRRGARMPEEFLFPIPLMFIRAARRFPRPARRYPARRSQMGLRHGRAKSRSSPTMLPPGVKHRGRRLAISSLVCCARCPCAGLGSPASWPRASAFSKSKPPSPFSPVCVHTRRLGRMPWERFGHHMLLQARTL